MVGFVPVHLFTPPGAFETVDFIYIAISAIICPEKFTISGIIGYWSDMKG
jgi:hypothetical protein